MTAEYQSNLEKFSQCADILETAIQGIPAKDLDRSLEENSWSIRQIIHHLADGALIWSMFFRQVLGDSAGDFDLGWYWSKSQDEWGDIWHYQNRDIKSSLELYRACNQSIIELLRAASAPQNNFLHFNFPGEEPQTMTMEGTIRWQRIHLSQHLDEINKIMGT